MTGSDELMPGSALNVRDLLLSRKLSESELISVVMEIECRRLGLSVAPMGAHGILASSGDRSVPFFRASGPSVSRSWEKLFWNKSATKVFLQRADLPVPIGRTFTKSATEDAVAFASSLAWEVVLKPNASSKGSGFVSGITDEDSFRGAFTRTARTLPTRIPVLVEQRAPGMDLRLYILDGRISAGVVRRSAHIIGDGKSTLRDLVDAENSRRETNPHFRTRKIQLDDVALRSLATQGLEVDSVPPSAVQVPLRANSNVSSGGTIEDVTSDIHRNWAVVAHRLATHLRPLRQFAVDIIVPDPTFDPTSSPYHILELEADPATTSLHFPLTGSGRNICGAIVQAHFPDCDTDHFSGLPLSGRGGPLDYSAMVGAELQAAQLALTRLEQQKADIGPIRSVRQLRTASTSHPPADQVTAPDKRESYTVTVEGRVQGVGYRRWVARQAKDLSVHARAENQATGVRITVLGSPPNVRRFIARLLRGPRRARVIRMNVQVDAT